MSDSSSDQRNQRSGGQRRSGGSRRRRNNGGRNRDNRNRDGRNRDGRNRDGRSRDNRGGQQGRRGGGRSGQRRPPKPTPLTWWQKLLKAIGLYDPDKAPKRTSPSRVPQAPERKGAKPGTRSGQKPKSGSRTTRNEPKPVETNRLYIGNLSYDATEYDLEDLFKGAGSVLSVEIVYNRNTHRSKGYGFIEMGSIEEAKRAVEILHDQSFMDRQMIVSGAKSKGPAEGDRAGDSEETPEETPENVPVEDPPVEKSYPIEAPGEDPDETVKPTDGSEEAA